MEATKQERSWPDPGRWKLCRDNQHPTWETQARSKCIATVFATQYNIYTLYTIHIYCLYDHRSTVNNRRSKVILKIIFAVIYLLLLRKRKPGWFLLSRGMQERVSLVDVGRIVSVTTSSTQDVVKQPTHPTPLPDIPSWLLQSVTAQANSNTASHSHRLPECSYISVRRLLFRIIQNWNVLVGTKNMDTLLAVGMMDC